MAYPEKLIKSNTLLFCYPFFHIPNASALILKEVFFHDLLQRLLKEWCQSGRIEAEPETNHTCPKDLAHVDLRFWIYD